MAVKPLVATDRRAVSPAKVDLVTRRKADETGLNLKSIRGPHYRCTPAHVKARWEIWVELAEPGVSIASIARAWPCDHTTVRNGLIKMGHPTCS